MENRGVPKGIPQSLGVWAFWGGRKEEGSRSWTPVTVQYWVNKLGLGKKKQTKEKPLKKDQINKRKLTSRKGKKTTGRPGLGGSKIDQTARRQSWALPYN